MSDAAFSATSMAQSARSVGAEKLPRACPWHLPLSQQQTLRRTSQPVTVKVCTLGPSRPKDSKSHPCLCGECNSPTPSCPALSNGYLEDLGRFLGNIQSRLLESESQMQLQWTGLPGCHFNPSQSSQPGNQLSQESFRDNSDRKHFSKIHRKVTASRAGCSALLRA